MKLIAVIIAVGVVVFAIVGYELVTKVAVKQHNETPDKLEDALDSYQENQSKMNQLEKKITKTSKKKNK